MNLINIVAFIAGQYNTLQKHKYVTTSPHHHITTPPHHYITQSSHDHTICKCKLSTCLTRCTWKANKLAFQFNRPACSMLLCTWGNAHTASLDSMRILVVASGWESHIHEESCDRLKAAVRCTRLILCTCTCIIHKREDFGEFLTEKYVE